MTREDLKRKCMDLKTQMWRERQYYLNHLTNAELGDDIILRLHDQKIVGKWVGTSIDSDTFNIKIQLQIADHIIEIGVINEDPKIEKFISSSTKM